MSRSLWPDDTSHWKKQLRPAPPLLRHSWPFEALLWVSTFFRTTALSLLWCWLRGAWVFLPLSESESLALAVNASFLLSSLGEPPGDWAKGHFSPDTCLRLWPVRHLLQLARSPLLTSNTTCFFPKEDKKWLTSVLTFLSLSLFKDTCVAEHRNFHF